MIRHFPDLRLCGDLSHWVIHGERLFTGKTAEAELLDGAFVPHQTDAHAHVAYLPISHNHSLACTSAAYGYGNQVHRGDRVVCLCWC